MTSVRWEAKHNYLVLSSQLYYVRLVMSTMAVYQQKQRTSRHSIVNEKLTDPTLKKPYIYPTIITEAVLGSRDFIFCPSMVKILSIIYIHWWYDLPHSI